MPDVALILLAGGKGTRFQQETPKQFIHVHNKAIALHSLDIFLQCPEIAEIIVVADPAYRDLFKSYSVKFALPGQRRQDSFENGLDLVSSHIPWVCVHDAARPLINVKMVEDLISEGKQHGASTLGIPARVTIKEVHNFLVSKTLNRETLWEIQTPQFAKKSAFIQGFKIAKEKNITVTDDVSLIELLGLPVKMVQGDVSNIKLTYREDLPFILDHASL